MDKVMQSVDEQLSHCKDDNAAHLLENNFTNDFMQLSLEEERSDDVLCGINESVMQDVQKSAIELLAARFELIDDVLLNTHTKRWRDLIKIMLHGYILHGMLLFYFN
jgi:hypothetical protein